MATPRGRAWDAPGVSRELERQRKDIEQIRRRMSQPAKIPPPSIGGGIIGVSRLEVLDWNYGSTSMWPDSGMVTDLQGSAGISDSGDGGVKVSAAGYYHARVQVTVGWDADPGYARLEVSSSAGWYGTQQTLPAIVTPYPAFKSEAGPTYGPLWLGSDDVIYPNVYWSHAGPGVVESFGFVEVTRYG